jgi:glycosyltransferase involved in cell wall biosynthesis
MTASAPIVSVIVPVRNGADSVHRLLDCLRAQTAPDASFEVIVVDDCSTDGTADAAGAGGFATVVRTSRHGGPYVARNLGLSAARGELIAFTDGDCRPDASWIERGIDAFATSDADLIAGHIEVPLGASPSIPALVDFARHYLDQEFLVGNGFGATANLWVRRDVFGRVGPFNERLLSGGDHEFGMRAAAAGATLVYRRDVVVTHAPRDRARELARKQFRLGYGSAQHLYFAEGPLRERAHVCLHPGAYLPHRRLFGQARLEAAGYRPGAWRSLRMLAVNYLFAQLPMIAGNIAGTVEQRRLPPRGAAG